ncbi:hypothetical protein G6011_00100 [Alternaria panax]|uniref:Uncharacterized protein n=1 Tax=Alternaria panax TaxID=48097 RepID=A0AAD4NVF3_9PLEO|nr:hypothetical protein G6011_00100 [Alternaria panax]
MRSTSKMNRLERFVIRLHEQNPRVDALLAMARPSYSSAADRKPFNIKSTTKVIYKLSLSLLNAYLTHHRGPGEAVIEGSDMKGLHSSAVYYILGLAHFPRFEPTQELLGVFTLKELRGRDGGGEGAKDNWNQLPAEADCYIASRVAC